MRYKLKFEIDYSNLSKDEMRDSKLSEVLSGDEKMLEIEIDPVIKVPSIGEIVILSDKEYKILSNKYKIESDCYTTILCVKLLSIIKEEEKKDSESRMKTMKAMMSLR